MHTLNFILADEAASLALGAALAAHAGQCCAEESLHIHLEGDLGAGKTTLARGLLRALGVTGAIKSPSYSLLETYPVSGINITHFDFYRLNHADEYLDAGLDEFFAGPGLRLVEWPDKAAPHLPQPDLVIRLDVCGQNNESRRAQVAARNAKGQACLTALNSFPASAANSSNTPQPA